MSVKKKQALQSRAALSSKPSKGMVVLASHRGGLRRGARAMGKGLVGAWSGKGVPLLCECPLPSAHDTRVPACFSSRPLCMSDRRDTPWLAPFFYHRSTEDKGMAARRARFPLASHIASSRSNHTPEEKIMYLQLFWRIRGHLQRP